MAEEDVQAVEVQNKEEIAKSIADKITNQQQSTFNALSQSAISTTQSTTITQTDNIVDSVQDSGTALEKLFKKSIESTSKNIVDSVQESAQSTTDSINSMMDVQTAGAVDEKVIALENKREGEKIDETRHSEFLDAINGIKLAVAPPKEEGGLIGWLLALLGLGAAGALGLACLLYTSDAADE